MSLFASLRSTALSVSLLGLLPVGVLSQSVVPVLLPPELSRPELIARKAVLTQNEKALVEEFGKLNFNDQATSVKVITDFILKHPDIGTGYALRAAEYAGCQTKRPEGLDTEKAFTDAKRASELPSDILHFSDTTTSILAKASLNLDKPREAIAILADAIAKSPDSLNGLEQSETGKIEQTEPALCYWAISDFDKMAIAAPRDWRVPLIRGVYFASLVNLADDALFAKAVDEYQRAATLNPKSPLPDYLIGEIKSKRALFSVKSMKSDAARHTEHMGVVPAFANAIRKDPSFTLAYLGRAEEYLQAHEPALAVRDFTVVLTREPENSTALADRANAYAMAHDFYHAISDFNAAIPLEFKAQGSFLNDLYESRGDAFVATGNRSKAIDDYTDAIALLLGRQLPLVTLVQMRALYPESKAMSDSAFLRVLREAFAPEENEGDFAKGLTQKKSPWQVSFMLSDLYQKRGDSSLQSQNYGAALMDFRRIYDGVPNMASSLERWRSAGYGSYLLDVKTSIVIGNNPILWLKHTDKLDQESVIEFSIICSTRKIREESAVIYDKDGNVKSSEDAGEWAGIIPDTLGEHLWESSCRQTR